MGVPLDQTLQPSKVSKNRIFALNGTKSGIGLPGPQQWP